MQQTAGLLHLPGEVPAGEPGDQNMVIGMDADLMPLLGHAAHQLLAPRDTGAHQKEGGGDLPQGQTVQKGGGGAAAGAVVEGEGHQRDRFIPGDLGRT